jgi:hypothetical protein
MFVQGRYAESLDGWWCNHFGECIGPGSGKHGPGCNFAARDSGESARQSISSSLKTMMIIVP